MEHVNHTWFYFVATEMERDEGGVCLPGQQSVSYKNEGISAFLLLLFSLAVSPLCLFFFLVLSLFKLVFNLFLKKFKQGKIAEQLDDSKTFNTKPNANTHQFDFLLLSTSSLFLFPFLPLPSSSLVHC